MLVAERNRLSTSAGMAVRPRIETRIAWLKQELDDLDQGLRQTLRQSPVCGRRTTCCAAYLASENRSLLPFWHTCPNWALSTGARSLPWWAWLLSTGTVGILRGKRTVWGGRARMRTALYMGAMVASRFYPVIRDFYQRLLSAGKPKKLALTACMRKLLIILNSMLKNGSSWNHAATKSVAHSYCLSRQLLDSGADQSNGTGRQSGWTDVSLPRTSASSLSPSTHQYNGY